MRLDAEVAGAPSALGPVVTWHHGANGSLIMFHLGGVPSAAAAEGTRAYFMVVSIPDLQVEQVMHGSVRYGSTGAIGGGRGAIRIAVRPAAGLAWGQVIVPGDIVLDGMEFIR